MSPLCLDDDHMHTLVQVELLVDALLVSLGPKA